jgi:hypothetical protein
LTFNFYATALTKYLYLTLALTLACPPLFAFGGIPLRQQEDSLRATIQQVAASRDTAQRMALNAAFSERLADVLLQDSAFAYPFDSVPYLYKAASPDGLVRLLTWNVPMPEGHRYYGFVLTRKSTGAAASLTLLRDRRRDARLVENRELQPHEWYGALYTAVVQRSKPYTDVPVYTLLGISPTGSGSNKKVVDVLNVKPTGECTFGAPLFSRKGKVAHRIIFEYHAQAVMELRYMERSGMIVFSSLVPMYRQLRGRYEHYIPGESYDGLAYENGLWTLRENVRPPSNIQVKRRGKVDRKTGLIN